MFVVGVSGGCVDKKVESSSDAVVTLWLVGCALPTPSGTAVHVQNGHEQQKDICVPAEQPSCVLTGLEQEDETAPAVHKLENRVVGCERRSVKKHEHKN